MRYKLPLFILLGIAMVSIKAHASTSSVSVQNTVDSSSNSTVTSNTQTHVKIETDGQTKEFNTTGNESVDWESDDGTAKVKINSNGTNVSTKDNQASDSAPTVTSTPSATPTKTKEEDAKSEAIMSPLSVIITFFKGIISIF